MKQKEQQAAEVDMLLTPLFRRNTAGLVDKLHQGEETEIFINYKFIQKATENHLSHSMEIVFIILLTISYKQT